MCLQDELLTCRVSLLPRIRPWSTQASAFAGMSSDSESNSDGEAPAPVKVEAAPSKVCCPLLSRSVTGYITARDTTRSIRLCSAPGTRSGHYIL